jgi:hypothetical protein
LGTFAASREREEIFLAANGHRAKIIQGTKAPGIETGSVEALAIKRQFLEGEPQRAPEFPRPPTSKRVGREAIEIVKRLCGN